MKFPSTTTLFKEVNASSLGILRLLLGIILLEDFIEFYHYFTYYLEPSEFYNTYEFFHWVRMMPAYYIDIFFCASIMSCLLFAFGIHYRLNAIITFLSWSYIFLVDKGHYNNHYYLVAIFLFFFCITNADRWGSLTKSEKNTIPYWQVLIFRWQFAILYFYGGLAKIHSDWLNGFPMRYWLEYTSSNYPSFIQPIFYTDFTAMAFSWGGLIFDLGIPFLLLSRRWRAWAIFPLIMFHTLNEISWNIGVFPTIMLASTPIFFDTDWAEKLLQKINRKFLLTIISIGIILLPISYYTSSTMLAYVTKYIMLLSYPTLLYLFWQRNQPSTAPETTPTASYYWSRKTISQAFLLLWFSFQLTFPFRHWLYQGHPSWTGEGHLFAWRMMLVDTADAWRMKLIVPETGEELPIAIDKYMNHRQYRKMRRTPKSFLRFAHYIRDQAIENGVKNPVIKMEIWKSVNNRAPKLLNDTTLNYATVPCQDAIHADWFTAWEEGDEKPIYRQDAYDKWKVFLKENGANTEAVWR